MPLSASVRLRLAASQTGSSDYGGPAFAPALEAVMNLANGTGANQADLLFVDERSVAASTNDDIDLAGVLTGAFGATITAAEVVGVLVINAPRDGAANVSSLTIGNGTNPFIGFLGGTTPTIGPIGPGGFFFIGCPSASGVGTVTAGSADVLRIANGAGGTATYQLGLLCRSA